ncbi:MAG: NAD-dependent epimerase/dehydratase family protein [Christensenellales bacterium]
MMQKSAVVTGATSFIGTSLIKQLEQDGYKVYAVVRPDSKNFFRVPVCEAIQALPLDMEKISSLPELLNGKIDLFYHLSWEGARVPYRDDNELQGKNYYYAINAIHTAAELGCKVFVGAGSQAEYGRFNGKVDESYRTLPLTEYGKAKLRTYETGRMLAESLHMGFVWPRIFSVYGEYDYPSTLIMTCIEKMLKNEDVPLSQCNQNWDYIYVGDVADALLNLGKKGKYGEVYNVASGNPRQLKEYVLEIYKIINSQSTLKFGAIPYSSEGAISFEPVVDKIKTELNWNAGTNFKTGIERIIKYMKEKNYEKDIRCNTDL